MMQAAEPMTEQALSQFGFPTGFVLGLDLGQSRDYSGLLVNERRVFGDSVSEVAHVFRYCHRWRLRTRYSDVARGVAEIMSQLPPRPEPPRLLVDCTGVGTPVAETLRDLDLQPHEVILTAGFNWRWDGRRISLPKSIMASHLSLAFQSSRIIFPADLPHLAQLRHELTNFSVTRSDAGNDRFNARSETDHDDLVTAMGLAVWGAERLVLPRTVFL
jgi:hypothetical protein